MSQHNFLDYESSDVLTRYNDVQNQTESFSAQGQVASVVKKPNNRTVFIGGRKQVLTPDQYNNMQARLKAREAFTKDLKRETPCLYGQRHNLGKVTKSNHARPDEKDLSPVETRHAIRENLACSRKESIDKAWSKISH